MIKSKKIDSLDERIDEMYCPDCGKEIVEKAIFCSFCGRRLKDSYAFGTIQLRCKSCNGLLSVDEGKKVLSCPYCQSKEMIVESEEVAKQRIQSNVYKDVETARQDAYREVELARQHANKEIEQIRQKMSCDIEEMRQKAYRDVEIAKTKTAKSTDPYMKTIKTTLIGALFIAVSFAGMVLAVELEEPWGVVIVGVGLIVFITGVVLMISAWIRRAILNRKK